MKLENQKIYSAFFRETKTFYTKESFTNILGLQNTSKETKQQHAERIFTKLLEQNVIKSCNRKQFDLNELNADDLKEKEQQDSSIINNKEMGFFFNFVGVVFVDDCVIKVYPKYIDLPDDKSFSETDEETQKQIEKHFSQVLRVIKILSSIRQDSSLNQQTQEKYNHLGMQIFLLEDYYRNGIYQNKETIIETNGEGEIGWDPTINETTAIIKNNKPYYVELQTINTRSNEFDYCKMLHESILCQCSQTLRKTGLLSYLGMKPCEINGMPLSSFGDLNYIKYKLQQEIRTQFVTKKRNQLISLFTYITETNGNKSSNSIKLFGTNNFEHIWESVCKSVFDDLYNNKYRLKNSFLPSSPKIKQLIPEYLSNVEKLEHEKNKTLNELIENAVWEMRKDFNKFNTNDETFVYGIPKKPRSGLTPDLITICNNNFYILDAKYYIININDFFIDNQPGIQDVSKQFIYANAFYKFFEKAGFDSLRNAFLMPKRFSKWYSDINNVTKFSKEILLTYEGDVCFDMLQVIDNGKLDSIKVFELYPNVLFDAFLSTKTKIEKLDEIFNKYKNTSKIWSISEDDKKIIDETKKNKLLIGFIDQSYYQCIYNKKEVIFFFPARKGYYSYDNHPELLFSTSVNIFNISNEDGVVTGFNNKYLEAKIKTNELKLVLKDKLSEILIKNGFKDIILDADQYYYLELIDVNQKDFNKKVQDELWQKVKFEQNKYNLYNSEPIVITKE